ncbi:F-box domain-containing protein [Mycena chlorophos]|uniref:F-box domain-containing protein n=1 Tax=Mycena chlorophos TaxID=658473 RepID=A0A8H6RZS9_MYCCL|nr:F-box domain-containing protein [Mycena chlorophos]
MAVASSLQFTVLRSVQSFTSILFNPLDPPCPRLPLPKRAIILDLPDELLWSIFSRCMDPHASPFSNENPLQPLMKVCVRWRAVILEAPQFWSHISFPGWRRHGKGITPASLKEDEERVGVQVVKSGDVPVTIRLVPVPDYDSKRVVETMLGASTRVAEAEFLFNNDLFKRVSAHAGGFPILQRLNVRLSEALDAEYNAAAAEFFGSLTALKSLSLASDPVGGIDWLPTLVPLSQMWARLRVCELTDCMVDDVLLILPHFSPGTRLSLILGKLRRVEDPKTLPIIDHTNIQSLSFNRCGDHFVETILRNITAPSLQRLAI